MASGITATGDAKYLITKDEDSKYYTSLIILFVSCGFNLIVEIVGVMYMWDTYDVKKVCYGGAGCSVDGIPDEPVPVIVSPY